MSELIMPDNTPFQPRIYKVNSHHRYEDNCVFADVSLSEGVMIIQDWYSAIESQGYSRRALEWITGESAVSRVEVVDAADKAMPFWRRMFDVGLVQQVSSTTGETVLERVNGDPAPIIKPATTAMPQLPKGILTGKQATQFIHDAMQSIGLPRTSKLNGGEITGWTTHHGATGFSVRRDNREGLLQWHVVVSGRPHMSYEEDEDGHRPSRPEMLCTRIKKLFEEFGVKVNSVKATGWQTAWDDDISYEILTDHPGWLENNRRLDHASEVSL
ncbi:hypothetical protein IFT57_08825 [Pseudomonas sp. CFBP 13719]|nr:hypothetical protein [Pseudomonas putida]MBD8681857.1 hypothetical protein [Pseudomonas sp. CFBP 13719]